MKITALVRKFLRRRRARLALEAKMKNRRKPMLANYQDTDDTKYQIRQGNNGKWLWVIKRDNDGRHRARSKRYVWFDTYEKAEKDRKNYIAGKPSKGESVDSPPSIDTSRSADKGWNWTRNNEDNTTSHGPWGFMSSKEAYTACERAHGKIRRVEPPTYPGVRSTQEEDRWAVDNVPVDQMHDIDDIIGEAVDQFGDDLYGSIPFDPRPNAYRLAARFSIKIWHYYDGTVASNHDYVMGRSDKDRIVAELLEDWNIDHSYEEAIARQKVDVERQMREEKRIRDQKRRQAEKEARRRKEEAKERERRYAEARKREIEAQKKRKTEYEAKQRDQDLKDRIEMIKVNWGWAPHKDRVKLINRIFTDPGFEKYREAARIVADEWSIEIEGD